VRYRAVFRNPYSVPVLVGICVDFHPCSLVNQSTYPEWLAAAPPLGAAESPYFLASELLEAVAYTLEPMRVRVEFYDERDVRVAECETAEARPCALEVPPPLGEIPPDPSLPAAVTAGAVALLRALKRGRGE
jgi:hypothetical protein